MTTQSTATLASRPPLRVPRALRIALLALAGAWLAYVVVANALVRTRALRGLLGTDAERLLVDYSSAWTWLPGRVEVRDLSLRLQDDNVQMLLVVPRATFQLDPFALLGRTFHATSVRADGVTFRVREKLEHPEREPRRVKAYPPIPGFVDPPLRIATPNLPIPESEYRLWTVELDDVVAEVRELWVMEYRYRGRGEVTGAFRLRPLRELWVDPSVLVTEGGALSVGEDDVLVRSRGRLEVRVEPYDVRVPVGAMMLRHASAHLALEGDVPSLAPLFRLYAPRAPVLVRRGAGHLGVDARLASGVLAAGSRGAYATADVEVDAPPGSVAGDLRVEAAATEELGVTAHAGAASFLPRGARLAAVTARDVHAEAALGKADLLAAPRVESVAGSVGALTASDLGELASLAPRGVTLGHGHVTASGRASWLRGAVDGRIDVGLDRAEVRVGSVAVTASGRAWVGLVAADAGELVALGPFGADLPAVSLTVGDARAEGLHAAIRARDAAVRPSGAGATFHLELGPGDRVVRLAPGFAALPAAALAAVVGSPDVVADVRAVQSRGVASATLVGATYGKLDLARLGVLPDRLGP